MECELYQLNQLKRSKVENNVPGIYALIHNNQVIYVGQSVNVRKRLLQHAKYTSRIKELQKTRINHNCITYKIQFDRYTFIQNNFDSISYLWIEEADRDKRNQLEEYYINKYKPVFNYAGVKCNFIPV